MKFKIFIVFCLIISAGIAVIANIYVGPILISRGNMAFDDDIPLLASVGSLKKQRPVRKISASLPPTMNTALSENFDTDYTVTEAGSMDESKSPGWWLSSGAYFYSVNGIGKTITEELSAIDPWRIAFLISNSLDTDNGYHPQNIFRLVTKSKWQNFNQEAYFRIRKNNVSESLNRNASNGLLLFNRYQDSQNLYYTGIRVDGAAVIKKKINGMYYTMAYKTIAQGDAYDRTSNPNLLLDNIWIGLKSVVTTNLDNSVRVQLYTDIGKTGSWTLALDAADNGTKYGGAAIMNEGYAGIRTDFMDVEFDGYKITKF